MNKDNTELNLALPDEAATLAAGAALLQHLAPGTLIFLHGNLGAGKTTFVRGALRGVGFAGTVKSPTFTLVESYEQGDRFIYHFDLYRLSDPEELEWMGIRDYLRPDATCFMEWPERGSPLLPRPDLELTLALAGNGRTLHATAHTFAGQMALAGLMPPD